jgi:hypothetical protein
MNLSFILYCDLWDTIKYLDKKALGELTTIIFEYMIEGKTITPENHLFFVFNPIKNTLDRDKEKYKSISEKRKESGKKGGLSKGKQTKAKKANAKFANQTIANEADNDNDSVNVNENDNVNANFKKWGKDDLIKAMTPYSERYPKEMLNTFFNYWIEPLPNGKLRLTAQDAWDTGRRLATWKKIDSSKQPEQKVVTRASMGVKMQ